MNQVEAQKIMENTTYLNNKILVFEKKKNGKKNKQYCRVLDKSYLFTSKDENEEQGAVKVRFKDLLTGQEFMEQLTSIARAFPEDSIKNLDQIKSLLLNILDSDEESKTLEWIESKLKEEDKKLYDEYKGKVEGYLFELWLESKVTRSTFKSNNLIVYSLRK